LQFDYLRRVAAADVQVVIYGHTHLPKVQWIGDKLFFNPGSLAPDDFGPLGPTIGLLRIDRGNVRPEIVPIPADVHL
jgi:predicted phosphodiesterase